MQLTDGRAIRFQLGVVIGPGRDHEPFGSQALAGFDRQAQLDLVFRWRLLQRLAF